MRKFKDSYRSFHIVHEIEPQSKKTDRKFVVSSNTKFYISLSSGTLDIAIRGKNFPYISNITNTILKDISVNIIYTLKYKHFK